MQMAASRDIHLGIRVSFLNNTSCITTRYLHHTGYHYYDMLAPQGFAGFVKCLFCDEQAAIILGRFKISEGCLGKLGTGPTLFSAWTSDLVIDRIHRGAVIPDEDLQYQCAC